MKTVYEHIDIYACIIYQASLITRKWQITNNYIMTEWKMLQN